MGVFDSAWDNRQAQEYHTSDNLHSQLQYAPCIGYNHIDLADAGKRILVSSSKQPYPNSNSMILVFIFKWKQIVNTIDSRNSKKNIHEKYAPVSFHNYCQQFSSTTLIETNVLFDIVFYATVPYNENNE